MRENDKEWIEDELQNYETLTKTNINILESLIEGAEIECLSVTGRTKSLVSIREKIKRKRYANPKQEMTDVTGIRVIVYFESDVKKVCALIEKAFNVDLENSMDREQVLATDQIGYRSVHYVCDLGKDRAKLPEFSNIVGLKFEIQVRTVLQHAWAELAHDRNYKFSGKLPSVMERKLFLYAGMLELADKGFDELSDEIDDYVESVKHETEIGNMEVEITSISLEEFIEAWAKRNDFRLEEPTTKEHYSELVGELKQFGIDQLKELNDIIPGEFATKAIKKGYTSTIYGVVRDWMMIHDFQRLIDRVEFDWKLGPDDDLFIGLYLSKEQVGYIYSKIGLNS